MAEIENENKSNLPSWAKPKLRSTGKSATNVVENPSITSAQSSETVGSWSSALKKPSRSQEEKKVDDTAAERQEEQLPKTPSWGATLKAASSRDSFKKEEPVEESPKPVKPWGQLKSTGNRDAVLAGKDIKERNLGLVSSKGAVSWRAPSDLKKTDARNAFAKTKGAASEMNVAWSKPVKPSKKIEPVKEAASPEKKWSNPFKGVMKGKTTDKKEEPAASTWKPTQLKSTGNKDAVMSGKDVKAPETKEAPKATTFGLGMLKSTGKKDAVLAGKDIKPESPQTRSAAMKQGTSWRSASELKSTGKKDEVLAGKDIKPEDPETRKAMMKQSTSWRSPNQLKSTGNRDAVLAGKDKIKDSTSPKEEAKPAFAGFKLKTVS